MSAGTRDRLDEKPQVAITGAGVLSPLGYGRKIFFQGLLEGREGLRPVTGFETHQLSLPRAGELNGDGPEQFLEGRSLRPLDRTSRLAAAAAELALEDSGYRQRAAASNREVDATTGTSAGLVLGTMYGSVRTISEFDRRALTAGPQYTKPFDFANSVINAAAGQAAIWHGLSGVNATVAGGTTAGVAALAHAADLIRAGRAGALVAGGAEELCFESCWGFARAGLLAADPGGAAHAAGVPFHARRNGFLPGEGAALLMLEEAEAARRDGVAILGLLTGSGSSFAPSRGSDAEASAAAVRRAITAALRDAGREPGDIDCLSVSASGGVHVDAAEAWGLAAALGDRVAELPITAIKGAMGESLGAAGALQTVTLLEAFTAGELPGIRGLDEPQPDLPLRLAGTASRQGGFRCGLVTSLSWDGHAWALVVEAA